MQFMNPTLRALATLLIAALVSVPASATVTSAISVDPVQHFTDGNGALLSGGKLFTYAAGTTTKQATYTDSTAGTTNTNPVILNSRGEANVWFDQSKAYKLVLAPSTDTDPPANPIWTVDNLSALSATNILSQITTFTSQIQSQSVNYAADSGSANAYVVTLSPVPSSLSTGFPVRFKAGNTNTGASTLNVNALGAVAIHRQDGSALQAGDITAGQMVYTSFDGTYFQLLWAGVSQVQLQSQTGNYAVDTGAANALVVAPTPAVTALVAGLTLRVQVKAANSGATTIAVSGLAAVAVHQQDGNPLQANALRPGGVFDLVYDGTAFQLQDGLFTGGYQVFTSSSTFTVPYGIYYLRVLTIGGGGGSAAATGNNGYPGTGGSAGGAMASGTYPVTPGQTITVTVGAAGLGGGSSLAAGTAGGTTSFGSLQSSTGGAPSTGTAGATSGGSVGGAQGLPSTAGGTQNASLLSLFTRASLAVGPGGGASSASYGGSNDGGGGGGGITLPGVTSPTGGAPAFSGTAPVGFGAGANGANGSYAYAAAGAQGAVYVEW